MKFSGNFLVFRDYEIFPCAKFTNKDLDIGPM